MSIILKDKDGLFVIAGGHVARPKFKGWYKDHCAIFALDYLKGKSKFRKYDVVRASHIGGTVYAKIKTTDKQYQEIWYLSGLSAFDYAGGKIFRTPKVDLQKKKVVTTKTVKHRKLLLT